jgi:hypothetical protein
MKRFRKHPSKKFREFSKADPDKIGVSYCSNLASAVGDYRDDRKLSFAHIAFMLWAYEYDFFTIPYASKRSGFSESYIRGKVLPTIRAYGLIDIMYSRSKEGITMEQLAMRNIEKEVYSNRYSLTQKGKLHVQDFYKKLEGKSAIKRKKYWLIGGQIVDPQR